MPEPSAAALPVPPEAAWFAGIGDARNRSGYLRDVREFMAFCGLDAPAPLPGRDIADRPGCPAAGRYLRGMNVPRAALPFPAPGR